MIRDYGDAVEADLAFRGIDLRDLYRSGSGLTPRRLYVLVRALPPEALLWNVMREAEEQIKPTADQIRDRAAHYRKQAGEAES